MHHSRLGRRNWEGIDGHRWVFTAIYKSYQATTIHNRKAAAHDFDDSKTWRSGSKMLMQVCVHVHMKQSVLINSYQSIALNPTVVEESGE